MFKRHLLFLSFALVHLVRSFVTEVQKLPGKKVWPFYWIRWCYNLEKKKSIWYSSSIIRCLIVIRWNQRTMVDENHQRSSSHHFAFDINTLNVRKKRKKSAIEPPKLMWKVTWKSRLLRNTKGKRHIHSTWKNFVNYWLKQSWAFFE